jgi:hypothetical protein
VLCWSREGGLIDVLSVPGVTILLSLTVFHNLVAETLPQVSDAMPVLGIGHLGPYQCVDYSQTLLVLLCCTYLMCTILISCIQCLVQRMKFIANNRWRHSVIACSL